VEFVDYGWAAGIDKEKRNDNDQVQESLRRSLKDSMKGDAAKDVSKRVLFTSADDAEFCTCCGNKQVPLDEVGVSLPPICVHFNTSSAR